MRFSGEFSARFRKQGQRTGKMRAVAAALVLVFGSAQQGWAGFIFTAHGAHDISGNANAVGHSTDGVHLHGSLKNSVHQSSNHPSQTVDSKTHGTLGNSIVKNTTKDVHVRGSLLNGSLHSSKDISGGKRVVSTAGKNSTNGVQDHGILHNFSPYSSFDAPGVFDIRKQGLPGESYVSSAGSYTTNCVPVHGCGEGTCHTSCNYPPPDCHHPPHCDPVPVPSTVVMSSILFGMFGVVWSYKRLKQTTTAA
jgi:hypothetical protein